MRANTVLRLAVVGLASMSVITAAVAQDISVTYAIPVTIAAAPSYVAAENGYWADQGLAVSLQFFSSGRQALDALLAHEAEVMSVSETPPMHAVIQGQKIYWVATVGRHSEAKVTVRSDRLKSPGDMRGKTIATLPGTNSDYYMYLWLDAEGLAPSDVNIVSMQPPQMVQSLLQGDIDAMFAWEPHNYNAYSRLPDATASWPTELYSGRHSIIMNQDYTDANPVVVEKLIAGLIEAENFIKENPADAIAIVAKVTGMETAVLERLWPEYEVKVELDDGLLALLEKEAAWAISIGETPGRVAPSYRDFIYLDAMMNAGSERVGQTLVQE